MIHTRKRKIKGKKTVKRRNKKNTAKQLGGDLEPENERLLQLLFSLLTVLKFDTSECQEIYDIISTKVTSEVGIDFRNVLEFVNLSFSVDQNLTEAHDVPQIFDFDNESIQLIDGVGQFPTENKKKEFITKMKSYSTIDFTNFRDMMSFVGFSPNEQQWITTRLELIHNTTDGPISMNKVIERLMTMIKTMANETRNSFMEVISVYDHYGSFK
jgi:hypothetical protein